MRGSKVVVIKGDDSKICKMPIQHAAKPSYSSWAPKLISVEGIIGHWLEQNCEPARLCAFQQLLTVRCQMCGGQSRAAPQEGNAKNDTEACEW